MAKIFYFLIVSFVGIHGLDLKTNLRLPFSLGSAYHLCRRNPNGNGQQNVWICSSPTSPPTNPPKTSTTTPSTTTTTTDVNNNVSATNEQWSVTESTKHARPRVGQLIFSDEFEYFNLETWNHEITMAGGGNWEFQVYMNNRSNSFVKDGVLNIKPTLTADKYGEPFLMSGTLDLNGGAEADQCTNPQFFGCDRTGNDFQYLPPIISARIRTMKSFAFKYGRVVIRAKLPSGDWLWPAIWLLPLHNQYGNWPSSGEIDIVESRGNKNLFDSENVNIGVNQVASTLHFAPYEGVNTAKGTHFINNLEPGQDFSQDYHIFELEWTPDFIKFKVDSKEIGSVTPEDEDGFGKLYGFDNDSKIDNPWRFGENKKMAPFDQKFYITINLAVGGIAGYFPDEATGTEKPWSNVSPQAYKDFWEARDKWLPTWQGEKSSLKIDYIRVFAV